MPIETFTHNPNRVILTIWDITIGGVVDEDDAIMVEYQTDEASSEAGYYGDVAHIVSMDLRGTLTVKILQGSSTNTLLGLKSRGFRGPFSLVDLNSNMICNARDMWVKKRPPAGRGKGQKPLEWQFEIAQLNLTPGGNKDV